MAARNKKLSEICVYGKAFIFLWSLKARNAFYRAALVKTDFASYKHASKRSGNFNAFAIVVSAIVSKADGF